MESHHRQILNENAQRLSSIIQLNDIKDLLLERHIFNKLMLQDILKWPTESEQMYFLLKELPTRGPNAFNNFVDILLEKGFEPAAKILDPQRVVTDTFNSQVNMKYSSKIYEGSKIYRMKSIPRGLCLIINNVKFPKDERIGSEIDAQRFTELFTKMGYKCIQKDNLEASEMELCLEEFAKNIDHVDLDSAIIIILTHGDKHILYGVDDNYIYEETIIDLFSNIKCFGLQGKPKMFFIQACRGSSPDIGTQLVKKCWLSSGDRYDTRKIPEEKRMQSISDILVFYPTLPNFYSIRNESTGSWLCDAIVNVFSERAKDTDLQEMVNDISEDISRRCSEHGHMQAPEATWKLWKKKLYFNPVPLPSENPADKKNEL